MAETTMPVAEAAVATHNDEQNSYEFAFHVLPTVTEGEVSGVFDTLKSLITNAGGTLTAEEAPERIDLAYEIVKAIEGKNRKFGSAYFGWVRFQLAPEALGALTAEVEAQPQLLRFLVLKLSRLEEENPFRYHEYRNSQKMVATVDMEQSADDEGKSIGESPKEVEEAHEVSETELDESLEKITSDNEEENKEEA
ncbi:30S ribosomal protein S6 [Candidatus Kaiserbacteria bacterium]|nr:30S ribosomal protein S6 [Candidatus Kaiserbacteria bacterium]